MKTKKKAAIIIAMAISLLFIVGGLIAYLTDGDSVKNHFTIGNIEVELNESNWVSTNAIDLYSNKIVKKNPIVKNACKNDCFVGVSVSGLKNMVDNNFIVGILNDDVLVNENNEVFCWNNNFVLVTRNGAAIESGIDNVLTAEELNEIVASSGNDLLYFAYRNTLGVNKETEALFDAVQYTGDDIEPRVRIIKYFTKDDGSLYSPVEQGYCTDGTPAVNGNEEYIYKYKIAIDGQEKDEIYETYNDAETAANLYKDELDEDFYLYIKASAIQSTNDAINNWENIESWYPQLSSDF